MGGFPRARQDFKGISFDGKVVYKTGEAIILADEVDGLFIDRVRKMLHLVCGDTPTVKFPSYDECRYCKIARSHCPERIDEEPDGWTNTTDDF